MLIVPRKRIWTQQPQGSASRLDYSHPLASHVVAAWIGSGDQEIVRNDQNAAAAPQQFIGQTGRGATGFSIYGTYYEFAKAPYKGRAFTVVTVASTPSGYGAMVSYNGAGAGGGWKFSVSAGGNYLLLTFGGVADYQAPSAVISRTSPFVAAVSVPLSGNARFFVDGKFRQSVSIGTPNTPSAPKLRVGVASNGSSISDHFPGVIYATIVLDFSASDAEIASLSENPWQIFRAPDSRIFVPTGAGAGGGDSLTASSVIALPATVGSPLLSQKHALSALSIITAPAVVASPEITQRHALSASAVSASPAVVGSASITQRHALTATAISAAPAVVGSPTLTEIVAGTLSALPVIAAPAVVGTPAITQRHALSAGAISAGPATFGTLTLAQQHALIAQGVTAGAAVVGAPVLSEGGAVIFTSAPNGGGYSRAGENHTRPPQTNTVRH